MAASYALCQVRNCFVLRTGKSRLYKSYCRDLKTVSELLMPVSQLGALSRTMQLDLDKIFADFGKLRLQSLQVAHIALDFLPAYPWGSCP